MSEQRIGLRKLSYVVEMPCTNGDSAEYELVAAISGEHFVAHLRFIDEWYVANDKQQLRRAVHYLEFDVEW